jgi:hypothetical protein
MEISKLNRTLDKMDKALDRFQSMARTIDTLHSRASQRQHHALAISTKKALEGLDGMIDWVNSNRRELLYQRNFRGIPINYPDKPKLTLIQGGKE